MRTILRFNYILSRKNAQKCFDEDNFARKENEGKRTYVSPLTRQTYMFLP